MNDRADSKCQHDRAQMEAKRQQRYHDDHCSKVTRPSDVGPRIGLEELRWLIKRFSVSIEIHWKQAESNHALPR
jgi:hypothetical protein